MDVVRYEPGIRLVVFITAFLLLAAGEALSPRRARAVVRRWRWPANVTLVALNTLLIRMALPVTAVGMAVITEQRGWGLLHAVGPIPVVLAVGIAVLLLDFAIYLQHVLFHAVSILWRMHRVHHADFPWLDRVLRLVVVTPDMHRVHHSAWGVETNTNFGFTFPWWDHLCRTYRAQPAAGHEAMTVGLTYFRDPKYLRLDTTLLQPLLDGNGSQTSVSDSLRTSHPGDR